MLKGQKVNVIGDSKLIISFMNKVFKPGKRAFVQLVDQTRALCRKIAGKVSFFHVKREANTWADFLS